MEPARFAALDGTPLVGAWHRADGEPLATVVIAPAMAVPASFYEPFARHLAGAGFDVLRFDYRGIGASRPAGGLRGFEASATVWGALDLGAALDLAAARGRPVALVGHSFGGQAIGLTDRSASLDALLTVGSQLGWYGHWQGLARLRLQAIWRLWLPAVTRACGYLPGWAGMKEDIPAGPALEWARWCRSPGYLTDHVPGARERFAAVRCAARVLAVTDDDYAPETAVAAYAALLPGVRHERLAPADAGLEGLGHFGFFRRSARPLWDPAAAWLADAVAHDRRQGCVG